MFDFYDSNYSDEFKQRLQDARCKKKLFTGFHTKFFQLTEMNIPLYLTQKIIFLSEKQLFLNQINCFSPFTLFNHLIISFHQTHKFPSTS